MFTKRTRIIIEVLFAANVVVALATIVVLTNAIVSVIVTR